MKTRCHVARGAVARGGSGDALAGQVARSTAHFADFTVPIPGRHETITSRRQLSLQLQTTGSKAVVSPLLDPTFTKVPDPLAAAAQQRPPHTPRPARPPLRVRTLFLSDLHLGARAARAKQVLDFLQAYEAETIYLVGDILDIWHGGRVHWTEATEAVMQDLRRRVAGGTRIVYLAGNHDAVLRYPGAALPEGWTLREAITHRAGDGRRYLVLHGDQCDSRLMRWHVMTRLGSRADALLRGIDAWLGRYLPARTPGRASRIERAIGAFNGLFVMAGRFEGRLVALARASKADGVICGHSHKPMLREIDGTIYANCGDWIDSFTALTETFDGVLRLVEWAPQASTAGAALPFGALAKDV